MRARKHTPDEEARILGLLWASAEKIQGSDDWRPKWSQVKRETGEVRRTLQRIWDRQSPRDHEVNSAAAMRAREGAVEAVAEDWLKSVHRRTMQRIDWILAQERLEPVWIDPGNGGRAFVVAPAIRADQLAKALDTVRKILPGVALDAGLVKTGDGNTVPDLTTPAGMAALRGLLSALPPGLLREALAARDEPA